MLNFGQILNRKLSSGIILIMILLFLVLEVSGFCVAIDKPVSINGVEKRGFRAIFIHIVVMSIQIYLVLHFLF